MEPVERERESSHAYLTGAISFTLSLSLALRERLCGDFRFGSACESYDSSSGNSETLRYVEQSMPTESIAAVARTGE